MSGPLSVRLADGVRDEHVTRHCPSLSFTKTAPGGHAVAQMRINLPRGDWPDLGDADRVWIYDKATGATVWEGYTNSPGTSRDDTGEGFDLTAQGGMMLASDDRRPTVYIDLSQDSGLWVRTSNDTPAGTGHLGAVAVNSPTSGKAILFQFPPGSPIANGDNVAVEYMGLVKTGQRLLNFAAPYDAGKTDADYQHQVYTRLNGGGTPTVASGTTFITILANLNLVAPTDFPVGDNTIVIRILRTGGATTIADDTTWGAYYAPRIRPILLNANGTDDLTAASDAYVLATEVVNDVVGRMLPRVDAVATSIATTTATIDQLAYHQAVSARTILDDLALWEPDYLWEILHTTGTGKHVFNYRAWPTTARYEVSNADGYSKTGTDSGLCNRLAVSWNDEAGIPQSVTVTAAVPALDDVGRIRHADPINLPDGRGSTDAASTIGAGVLADINAVSNAASATIRRPIVDLASGSRVQPWEIQPGYLARVRETGDLLPISEVTYRWTEDGTSEASLSLGRPRLTLEQRVVRLDRPA